METTDPIVFFWSAVFLSVAISCVIFFGIVLFCNVFGEMLKEVLTEVLQKTGGG